jgi:hypothetical protein
MSSGNSGYLYITLPNRKKLLCLCPYLAWLRREAPTTFGHMLFPEYCDFKNRNFSLWLMLDTRPPKSWHFVASGGRTVSLYSEVDGLMLANIR